MIVQHVITNNNRSNHNKDDTIPVTKAVADQFIRARILSGMKKSKRDLAEIQTEYEMFKKYKMRTAISK